MNPPQERAGAETRRRSTRLTISIPVTIQGKDSSGKVFEEKTRTILVNAHGGLLETAHQLNMGATLLIRNPALEKSVEVRVAWLDPKPSPGNLFRIGVELAEPQNIWGIDFPPLDWAPSPPGKGVVQKPAQVEPTSKAPVRERVAAEAPKPPATVSPARAGGPAPQPSAVPVEVIATLQLAATRFGEQIEEMTNAQMKLLREHLAKLSGETREALRKELEKVGAQCLELSKAQLREQTEAHLRQGAKQLEEMRLQALASAVEGFRTKVTGALAALEAISPGKPGKPDQGKP